jgi:hypothetical protein
MLKINTGLVAVLMVAACTQALAHHSFAMFDTKKEVTIKGKVSAFAWTNPHAFLHVVVPKAGGASTEWQLELPSPNMLKRRGWRSTSMKPGDVVTVVFNPLRDGGTGGSFLSATLADGTTLLSGAKPQD